MNCHIVVLTILDILFLWLSQINNIKKSLKTAHQDDEQMIADSKEMSYPVAVGKKAVRSKSGG